MKKYICIALVLICCLNSFAQVNVGIDFSSNHIVGNVDSFDREKFITVHASSEENDFDGEEDKLEYLVNDLDVYFGRETGAMRYQLSLVPEDANRKGFADVSEMKSLGEIATRNYAREKQDRHKYEKGSVITAAQDQPYYPNGEIGIGDEEWLFSTNDTDSEPFGTATGHYMANYLKYYYGEGGTTGRVKPKYVEVMNEPVWPLVEEGLHGGATLDGVFKLHISVADQIRALNPEVQVGGYTTAFPDLEKYNFKQWEDRWKRFIDEIGPKMDFYSIHLYDFPGISNGKKFIRKGSHMEATMDMIEHYSTLKYGEVKPWLISEYGAQCHDWYNQPWTPYRDWLFIRSFNAMMMQLMERSNHIIKAIPFSVAKGEWGRNSQDVPYYWRLMRQTGEPNNAKGDWVWTEIIKFYELWQNVNGKRYYSASSDIDIRVDAYSEGNKAFVILHNMDTKDVKVNLKSKGLLADQIENSNYKKLYLNGNKPVLFEKNYDKEINYVNLEKDATVIVEYNLKTPIITPSIIKEQKVYATEYKKEIKANESILFNVNGIHVSDKQGYANLRLGIGRAKLLQRTPMVTINGKQIIVPFDYRGGQQDDREMFFGVIEIPISYKLIQENNVIEFKFSDAGGFISSLALQAFHKK